MSQYRDEREALRARAESLEQALVEARDEAAELRADGPAAERIERLTRELTEAQRELSQLRGDPPSPRGPVLFGGAAGSLGIAVLATVWLFGARHAGALPCGSSDEVDSIPYPALTDSDVGDGADLPQPRGPACPRVSQVGRVTSTEGSAEVETGAVCDVGVIPLDGQCKVRVRCAGNWLFDGFAQVRADGRVVDDRPSVQDLDPRVNIDARRGLAEVSDDAAQVSWSVKIAFASH